MMSVFAALAGKPPVAPDFPSFQSELFCYRMLMKSL